MHLQSNRTTRGVHAGFPDHMYHFSLLQLVLLVTQDDVYSVNLLHWSVAPPTRCRALMK